MNYKSVQHTLLSIYIYNILCAHLRLFHDALCRKNQTVQLNQLRKTMALLLKTIQWCPLVIVQLIVTWHPPLWVALLDQKWTTFVKNVIVNI